MSHGGPAFGEPPVRKFYFTSNSHEQSITG